LPDPILQTRVIRLQPRWNDLSEIERVIAEQGPSKIAFCQIQNSVRQCDDLPPLTGIEVHLPKKGSTVRNRSASSMIRHSLSFVVIHPNDPSALRIVNRVALPRRKRPSRDQQTLGIRGTASFRLRPPLHRHGFLLQANCDRS